VFTSVGSRSCVFSNALFIIHYTRYTRRFWQSHKLRASLKVIIDRETASVLPTRETNHATLSIALVNFVRPAISAPWFAAVVCSGVFRGLFDRAAPPLSDPEFFDNFCTVFVRFVLRLNRKIRVARFLPIRNCVNVIILGQEWFPSTYPPPSTPTAPRPSLLKS